MSDVAISVENISKCYRIGTQGGPGYHRLSEMLTGVPRALWSAGRSLVRQRTSATDASSVAQNSGEFWALKDVSFEVKQGEVVAIIGRNGAGKSTLLKILSRITEPTSGRFGLRGRVASLLEVGTGFHPELTGRENIYVSGVTLGMTRAEIKKRFDEIVDFSGVEKFLDTPVKHYSSGMQVRLGFAVAAHLESEILIIDEVLAVGDANFQKKCSARIHEVGTSGRTVLIVSHDLNSLKNYCTSALLLTSGATRQFDSTQDAFEYYNRRDRESINDGNWEGRLENESMAFTKSWLENYPAQGLFYSTTDCITICASLELFKPLETLVFGLRLYSGYGQLLAYRLFDDDRVSGIVRYETGHHVGRMTIPANTLASGRYRVGFEAGIAWQEVLMRDGVGELEFEVVNLNGLGARFPVESSPGFNSVLRPDWQSDVL